MKKLFALVLVLMMSLACLPALAEETEIIVWCWDPAFNLYAINEAAKIYAEINPDVKITIDETASGDVDTKMTVALASGQTDTLANIILCQDNNGRKFLNTFPGAYFEMTDLVDYDNFAQYKINHFTYDGGVYGVPFDNGCAAMFLRTDYLAEAGYGIEDLKEITWDELIEAGLKVKEATGNFLLTTQTGYRDYISMMVQSAGSWFFDADGTPNLTNNPAVREAVETIVKLRQSGIVKEAADWTEYIASFNNGSAAGTIQGCWIIGSVTLVPDQEGKWGMTTVPRLTCEGATNYSSQGGSSWMCFADDPKAEIAVDFLSQTFGASVDFYQIILKSSGAIATYLPAAGGPAYGEPHEFFAGQKVFEDLMEYSANIPMVEYGMYNYEARDAVSVAIEEVFNGGDIDAALQTAQETLEFLMEE
ncbi:MAG: ABC transporter substrate-binding protein [Clostridia bacterium]|nr:ABC transporter substrate-binding protein [Clostridia bacterium]